MAGKPILALKAGRSPEGARAAASHTGSMAGSDTAYDAIFMQGGIQRVEGVSELFNYALAFSTQPLPKGNRIAIVTNSGGPGIMATDALIRPGITMAQLSEATKKKLREKLPPTASVNNPVDVIGDADAKRYEAAIRYTLEDENVDGAIVILAPAATTEIMETAKIVPRVAKDIDKPILCSFMGLVDVSEGIRYLEQNGIPNYVFPEEASRTMAAMIRYRENMKPHEGRRREVFRLLEDQEKAAAVIAVRLSGRKEYFMTEKEAHELLRCYGFPLLKSRLVTESSEISAAIKEIGLPVVMKLDSPDILHKSDAGGVRLGIKSQEQAEKTFHEIIESAKKYKPGAEHQRYSFSGDGTGGRGSDPRFYQRSPIRPHMYVRSWRHLCRSPQGRHVPARAHVGDERRNHGSFHPSLQSASRHPGETPGRHQGGHAMYPETVGHGRQPS